MPTSADSKNKRVANSSPVTHQTVRQQGGTGEDSHIHLADWTLSVAAIEKKKKKVTTRTTRLISGPVSLITAHSGYASTNKPLVLFNPGRRLRCLRHSVVSTAPIEHLPNFREGAFEFNVSLRPQRPNELLRKGPRAANSTFPQLMSSDRGRFFFFYGALRSQKP